MTKGTACSIDSIAIQSKLHRWNATLKVFFSVGILITCICVNQLIFWLAVIACMSGLNVIVGKISLKKYLSILRIPIVFLLLGGLAIAVEISTTGEGFPFVITERTVRIALYVTLKALAAISALYMLILSTPMHELLMVFRKLHMPRIILELMHLTYRFIFVLIQTYENMHFAAASRMGYRNLKCSLRTFGQNLSNLWILAIKKSTKYYNAMESRGFDGEMYYLAMEKKVIREQVLCCIIVGMILSGILFAR